MAEKREVLVSIKDLCFDFTLRGQTLHALRGISLDILKGESLAIVGESGSGKSVFVANLMGLNASNGRITGGSILYGDKDLAKITDETEWNSIRGSRIAMVMQDPMTSLNPLKTIGWQICEALALHQDLHGEAAKQEACRILTEVGISEPERRYKQFPHEFSGGMRQRVVIAIAVACKPEILICDEPTTALDVTIQAQILGILKKMQKTYGLTVVYITHDLGVVANVADRVAVMYAGDIVEVGTSNEIFYDPKHPYTWALLSSLPQLGIKGKPLYSIQGTPPDLFQEIHGDAFAARNPHPLKIDFVKRPPMFKVSDTHFARTWLLDPRAPRMEPPEHIRVMIDKGRALGLTGTGAETAEKGAAQ
ncbi:MAG: ABC transporter ATP-binding protein [Lachnospiraceae bacterium]|jgi:oligopeptide transport system ATP-binding protein|nr:ABC transporter ATP-binding protein [Lachnospiraceae bacterium]